MLWAPTLTLAYCLFWKRLILDGWPGVYYSLQRTYAELLLSLELLDRRLRGKAVSGQPLAISKKAISEAGQSLLLRTTLQNRDSPRRLSE